MTYRALTVMAAALLLSACASTPEEESADEGAPVEQRGGGAVTQGAGSGTTATKPVAEDAAQRRQAELLSRNTVHFSFDSSTLDDDAREIVSAHGGHLASRDSVKVTLSGHADERGSAEYNLALGERRAQAVERMLKTLGVSGSRLTVVSYGEEKPACSEHDESCWTTNRRVELKY